jgi:hypothetical protein
MIGFHKWLDFTNDLITQIISFMYDWISHMFGLHKLLDLCMIGLHKLLDLCMIGLHKLLDLCMIGLHIWFDYTNY